MKKNLLLLFIIFSISIVFVGCKVNAKGNDLEIVENLEPIQPEYTTQQLLFIKEFEKMVEIYKIVDKGFQSSEYVNNEELVKTMNDISSKIIEIEEACNDPEFLTLEVMKFYGMSINTMYLSMDEIAGYLNQLNL